MKLFNFITFFTLFLNVQCLKILGIFEHPGKSHYISYQRLLEGLSEKGHLLTVIGYFPLEKKLPGYHDVILKDNVKHHDFLPFEAVTHEWWSQFMDVHNVRFYTWNECFHGLTSENYLQVLKSEETFDLIISEYFAWSCLLVPLADKYKVPVIGFQTNSMMPWSYDFVGAPNNPSYIRPLLVRENCEESLFKKTVCTLQLIYNLLFYKYVLQKDDKNFAHKYLGKDYDFDSVLLNTSLMLINSHFSFLGAKPNVPNVIEVGGIHIGDNRKLPGHIEKWINESTHGVIYFSFGSMIKGHTFPEEKRQMFIRAFSRLPQRILWKWETDTMSGKPENVMIEKWMPQFDILSHPNVKAFIAHGGLLGATEAVHCGVPLIVMPQFGDQFTNAKAIEASGGGVILDYRSLDEESIYNALKTVLDPSFNKKAKELSARFRDRPMPPLETAIYWVEYVARHGGAPHLRTAAVGMPLYQYLLLDVIAFLSTILFLFVYISFVITRAIFRRLFKSKEKVKKN